MPYVQMTAEDQWIKLRHIYNPDVRYLKAAFVFDSDETHLNAIRLYQGDGTFIREQYPWGSGYSSEIEELLWDLYRERGYYNGVFRYDLDNRTIEQVGDAYVPEPETVIEWGD